MPRNPYPLSCSKLPTFVLPLSLAILVPVTSPAESLGEIVVRSQQPLISSVSTTTTIDASQIERRGDVSLEESLELVPNLSVRVGGQGVPRIDIRGLRSRQTRFLLNGIPINSTYDGQFDPGLIPTAFIDRIKVVTGAPSELYGAGSMSVINVLPRTGLKPLYQATVEAGIDGAHRMDGSIGGQTGELDYFINLSRRQRSGFDLADDFRATATEDGGERENSDYRRDNLFINLGYQAMDKLQFGFMGFLGNGEYGIPEEVDVNVNRSIVERVEDQRNLSVQGSFSYNDAGVFFTRGWVYANRQDEDEQAYDRGSISSITRNNARQLENEATVIGAGLQTGLTLWQRLRIALALDAHRDSFDQQGIQCANGNGCNPNQLVSINSDDELTVRSLNLEAEYALTDSLGLVAGAGRHWLDPDGLQEQNAGSYVLGLNWQALPDLNLRSSFARKVRAPSIRNLFDAVQGNPALGFETSYGVEIGADYRLASTTSIGATVFRREVDGFIRSNGRNNPFTGEDDFLIKGVELTFVSQAIERLDINAMASLIDTEDRNPRGVSEEIQNIPGLILNLDLHYRLLPTLGVHLSSRYETNVFSYDSGNNPTVKTELDSTLKHDFRVAWQPQSEAPLTVFAGIDNLFDRDYLEEAGLPAPGRTAYAGLSLRY